MITRSPMVFTSVEPSHGHEGTIVTLKGSGFSKRIRNNCVVLGGMGACARAQPGSTPTEMKVRIGPVAKEMEGDLLAWVGVGVDLHTEELSFGEAAMQFSESSIFRNGTPVASAGIKFKLTKASPHTYAGHFEKLPSTRVELGGQETGAVMRVPFPKTLSLSKHAKVDVCVVLKEPTLAIDFAAELPRGASDAEQAIRAIAKSIVVNAGLVGEHVFADVARNHKTGELELYVTKPYLSNGMVTIHLAS